MTNTTSARTIQEVLTIRRRAAELRVMIAAADAVKIAAANESRVTSAAQRQALAQATDNLRQAHQALTEVRHEIQAQTTGAAEPVAYPLAAGTGERRYAAVLLLDDPQLTPQQALEQARQDEATRYLEWHARVIGDQHEPADDEEPGADA